MRIEIKTKNEEHEAVLRLYAPILQKMMDSLRKEFRFKQPKSIVLRPRRNRRHKDTFANGLAGFHRDIGYWIAINIQYYKGKINDALVDTMAEETAHIAGYIVENKFGHTPLYDRMKRYLLKEVKSKRIIILICISFMFMGCSDFLQTEFHGYTMEQNFTSWSWTIILIYIAVKLYKKYGP